MHNDEFNRLLGFSCTVILLAFIEVKSQFKLKNLICVHCYAFLGDKSLFMQLNCDVICSLTYRHLVFR